MKLFWTPWDLTVLWMESLCSILLKAEEHELEHCSWPTKILFIFLFQLVYLLTLKIRIAFLKTIMKTKLLYWKYMMNPQKRLVKFLIFLIQNLCATWVYVNKYVSYCLFQDAFSGLMCPLQLEFLFDELTPHWRIQEVVDECSQFQRELVLCRHLIKAYPCVFFWEDCKMILSVSKSLPQWESQDKSIRLCSISWLALLVQVRSFFLCKI